MLAARPFTNGPKAKACQTAVSAVTGSSRKMRPMSEANPVRPGNNADFPGMDEPSGQELSSV